MAAVDGEARDTSRLLIAQCLRSRDFTDAVGHLRKFVENIGVTAIQMTDMERQFFRAAYISFFVSDLDHWEGNKNTMEKTASEVQRQVLLLNQESLRTRVEEGANNFLNLIEGNLLVGVGNQTEPGIFFTNLRGHLNANLAVVRSPEAYAQHNVAVAKESFKNAYEWSLAILSPCNQMRLACAHDYAAYLRDRGDVHASVAVATEALVAGGDELSLLIKKLTQLKKRPRSR